MKRLFFIIFFVPLLIVIIVLSVYKVKKPVEVSDYQLEFNSDLISSNLYAPDNLKINEFNSDFAKISWSFNNRNLIVKDGVPKEYSILSGFRVYRNGYWYKDLSGSDKSFLDKYLYPEKTYSYEVSALTFDNKIEGKKSDPLSITTTGGVDFPKFSLKIENILIEGDSITRGQKANPGDGWADQVGIWLTKNGSKNIINDAKINTFSFDLAGRIGKEILSVKPDLVIVGVGMNDLFAGNGNVASYSLGQYLQSFYEIIQLCQSQKAIVAIVGITPAEGKSEKVSVWNSALEDLAYNTNSIFVPTDYLSETMLVDSIHPNQEAHNEVAKKIISILYNNLR